ncbi:hypothetical protein [Romboutsia sp. Marseille-P6047]|uniref:hypothetical protein n=1 Tax=Romboutsia sp. Marseille-P6047 TaxID=2161817 RepID=UPI000F055202|nr:hypothetical protein [Romboutsia sp. Marseille-P6047]
MDFFINLGILGISLIMLGKVTIKGNTYTQELSNFKILDNIVNYMESEGLAKINLKYGKQLLITGIIGTLFYNTLGLLMVFVMVLVLSLYIINVFISGYKFYINIR